ncbi:MAG: IclR family transcriptional regulator [Nocardioidaceae bacterium]
MSNGTQSVDRAAELVSLVVRAEGPVSFTQLVEQTGLARSTASRLLQALERNGILERNHEGLFRGGALFAHYANRFDRVESLANAAQPMLERIAEETDETVNLGVPSGDTVVHAAQIDSNFILGATNWIDVEVPPHCSALGKVLYAFDALRLPKGRLEARTAASVTDPTVLESQLETIRRQGYAVTRGEVEDGLDALAAPVRDPRGHVIAAIGVSGPAFRLESAHQQIGELLVDESDLLTRILTRRAQKEASG